MLGEKAATVQAASMERREGAEYDFNEPLLHMFNKNGDFIRGQLGAERWASLVGSRSTVLLLGDGLGDGPPRALGGGGGLLP